MREADKAVNMEGQASRWTARVAVGDKLVSSQALSNYLHKGSKRGRGRLGWIGSRTRTRREGGALEAFWDECIAQRSSIREIGCEVRLAVVRDERMLGHGWTGQLVSQPFAAVGLFLFVSVDNAVEMHSAAAASF